jgi:uncharacterized cupredoxin-like copper-binding protein
MPFLRVAIVSLSFAIVGGAFAHDASSHASKSKKSIPTEEKAFGRAGDPKKASRTIKVDASDTMRFTPGEIHVKAGETIRFEVTNSGKTMHEMVLGSLQDLKAHAEHMRKSSSMDHHDEPYIAHVAPGKTERLVWQFTKTGDFYYGCLIPGHFEAGMIGKVVVR